MVADFVLKALVVEGNAAMSDELGLPEGIRVHHLVEYAGFVAFLKTELKVACTS